MSPTVMAITDLLVSENIPLCVTFFANSPEISFAASALDGPTGLKLFTRSWKPAQAPRALVAICHGVNSHSGQYLWAGTELAKAGFAVFALDLRGRGQSEGERFYAEPLVPRNLSGRTGRGDTCFSAYITERLTQPIAGALTTAAALVSLKMETPGPFTGTRVDVEEYIKAFYR